MSHEWPDHHVLIMLDLVENEGLTRAQVAERFNASRGAVCGLIYRVLKDTDAEPCECTKPQNKDGGMPRRWYSNPAAQRAEIDRILKETAKACGMPK